MDDENDDDDDDDDDDKEEEEEEEEEENVDHGEDENGVDYLSEMAKFLRNDIAVRDVRATDSVRAVADYRENASGDVCEVDEENVDVVDDGDDDDYDENEGKNCHRL